MGGTGRGALLPHAVHEDLLHRAENLLELGQELLEIGDGLQLGLVLLAMLATDGTEGFEEPDKILVETDSPYLAPVPYRGKSNQPAYVVQVAEKIAELRDISVEEVAELTTKNYFNLFGNVA